MNSAEEFRTAYRLPTQTRSARATQKTLIVEEFKEFIEEEFHLISGFKRNEAACLKELADLVYVCFQFASCMEWDLDTALVRVHESNMSKLGDDGHPIYREDGKVLKGPNYKEPTLTDLV